MKATERRLNDEKEKLSNEICRLKKQIEEKEAEKIRAVREAKADGDQRVRADFLKRFFQIKRIQF